jgi:hypothetical protein
MFKTVAADAGHNDIIKAGSNLSSSHNALRKLKRPWPLLYLVQWCGPKRQTGRMDTGQTGRMEAGTRGLGALN